MVSEGNLTISSRLLYREVQREMEKAKKGLSPEFASVEFSFVQAQDIFVYAPT